MSLVRNHADADGMMPMRLEAGNAPGELRLSATEKERLLEAWKGLLLTIPLGAETTVLRCSLEPMARSARPQTDMREQEEASSSSTDGLGAKAQTSLVPASSLPPASEAPVTTRAAKAAPTEEELVECISELLHGRDLNAVTLGAFRAEMEAHLGLQAAALKCQSLRIQALIEAEIHKCSATDGPTDADDADHQASPSVARSSTTPTRAAKAERKKPLPRRPRSRDDHAAENLQKTIAPQAEAQEAPKRSRSAWILYSTERRPAMKKEQPHWGLGQLTSAMSAEWKAMDADQRRRFLDMAAEDLERYRREYAAYAGRPSVARVRAKPTPKREPVATQSGGAAASSSSSLPPTVKDADAAEADVLAAAGRSAAGSPASGPSPALRATANTLLDGAGTTSPGKVLSTVPSAPADTPSQTRDEAHTPKRARPPLNDRTMPTSRSSTPTRSLRRRWSGGALDSTKCVAAGGITEAVNATPERSQEESLPAARPTSPSVCPKASKTATPRRAPRKNGPADGCSKQKRADKTDKQSSKEAGGAAVGKKNTTNAGIKPGAAAATQEACMKGGLKKPMTAADERRLSTPEAVRTWTAEQTSRLQEVLDSMDDENLDKVIDFLSYESKDEKARFDAVPQEADVTIDLENLCDARKWALNDFVMQLCYGLSSSKAKAAVPPMTLKERTDLQELIDRLPEDKLEKAISFVEGVAGANGEDAEVELDLEKLPAARQWEIFDFIQQLAQQDDETAKQPAKQQFERESQELPDSVASQPAGAFQEDFGLQAMLDEDMSKDAPPPQMMCQPIASSDSMLLDTEQVLAMLE
eukprot:TRINITY_DN18085_c0_g1_i2.p1 TRINITY_DN18085_c0_g1~~TRINITY_DN18085_c0_g1_i2.p1  ORF type:complete len:815 (+),score=206.78 TRINITY_DN18085_c0_g1_i2:203-2647(+)